MMASIPPALAAAYAEKVLLTAPELCRVLPKDTKTLNGHIRLGHLDYVETGIGSVCPRKGFTLDAVLRFLQERSFRAAPWTATLGRRSSASGGVKGGFLEMLAEERGSRKAKDAALPGASAPSSRPQKGRPIGRQTAARTKSPA